MSTVPISAALRRLVVERAQGHREYCLLPAEVAFFPHEVDDIVAVKHGGVSEPENLAFTCWRCNRHKGTDLASLDPETAALTPLFHPRRDRWADHFSLRGATLVGVTPVGRTTVRLLQVNTLERMRERERLGPRLSARPLVEPPTE